ncbi:hypothetical protein F5X99DRAFT_405710 [Biscogniauxia marginata]|nr:hypothetical protein F5X99DRAFT_405710 [Biscogniauxia marginata]
MSDLFDNAMEIDISRVARPIRLPRFENAFWLDSPSSANSKILRRLLYSWVNNPKRFPNQYFRLVLAHGWERKRLQSGVEQFAWVDKGAGADLEADGEEPPEELMMLPTDMPLPTDAAFLPALLELGIQRDATDDVVNRENVESGHRSAAKKSDAAGAPGDQNVGQVGR